MATTKTKPAAVWVDNFVEETSQVKIIIGNQHPAPDGINWPRSAQIQFDVIDLGPGGRQPSSVQIKINGDLVWNAGAFISPWQVSSTILKFSSPGSAVNDVWRFKILRAGNWEEQTTYTVEVSAVSTGTYRGGATWKFTSADTTAPEIDLVEAVAPRFIDVTFTEAVDSSTVTPSAFALTCDDPPYYLPEIASVVELTPYKYRITFDQELSNGKEYSLAVSDIQDLAIPPNTMAPEVVDFTSAVYPGPVDRKWDLWLMVPKAVRWADRKLTGSSPGHTQRFIQILQEVVDLWLYDVDQDAFIYDVNKSPEGAIDLLLSFLRNPFPFDLTANQKRKLLRMLPTINASKHAQGLIDVVFFFMGISITITPLGYGGGGWRLATEGLPSWRLPMYGKLGTTTRLLPAEGESAAPFTFIVDVPVALTDSQRQQLITIIEVMKNSHEHYIIQEPTPPPPATWLLGVAGFTELGITTRLGS